MLSQYIAVVNGLRRANAIRVFMEFGPFYFVLDRIYRINRIVFKQVEQEMQESLIPSSAGSGEATPVFLLSLLFSMLKPHLLYLLFFTLKSCQSCKSCLKSPALANSGQMALESGFVHSKGKERHLSGLTGFKRQRLFSSRYTQAPSARLFSTSPLRSGASSVSLAINSASAMPRYAAIREISTSETRTMPSFIRQHAPQHRQWNSFLFMAPFAFLLDRINRIDRIKRLLLTIDTVFVLVLKRCRAKVNQSMHGHCRPNYFVAYFIYIHNS